MECRVRIRSVKVVLNFLLGNFSFSFDVAHFLNQHFIKNRDRLSRLEEDIISYRANFELCVDIYFKGKDDQSFKTQIESLALGGLLEINTSITYRDYDRSFSTLSFSRLSQLYAFQKNILRFVKTNDNLITRYHAILARLLLF